MNEIKHTPGKWEVNKKVKTTVETCADGQGINIIADCSDIDGLRTRTESEANAALIALSPTLYEYAKKQALNGCEEALSMLESLQTTK